MLYLHNSHEVARFPRVCVREHVCTHACVHVCVCNFAEVKN